LAAAKAKKHGKLATNSAAFPPLACLGVVAVACAYADYHQPRILNRA
jgi:hypothetical protein